MLRKLLIVLALALAAACSSGGGAALPSGPDLMTKSAEAMKSVKSASFAIATEGKPKVQIRKADGRLTSAGDADGTLTIEVFGSLQEISFFVVGDTVHFKGPTGGFQKMSKKDLAQIYDPSLILSPAEGIAKLLSTATDPRVEGEEGAAYTVAATFSPEVLGKLIPGVSQGVNGRLLIDKASSRLTKATLPLQDGSVIVSFSDYDAPVTITPPAG
ncbi:LppX_LprAFG lipoprotein [Nonomuraea sp. NPDC050547]|uniref:LppX_LprAFG lipoprotein n=1 Tax=Nonomuraea sp. NPDC050547 TaxID=3364368 RepID=UPI0037998EC3